MSFVIIIVAVLAACITYFISINLEKGPVLASAIVTLASGIILPYICADTGTLLAGVATSGSYAAMVSQEKFPRLRDMVFVGIILGIVFSLTQDVFVGVGGKLGSIAAVAGFTWLGIKKLRRKVKEEKSKAE